MNKDTRHSHALPLWIFGQKQHDNSTLDRPLERINQTLDFLLGMLTPEMEAALMKKREKARYVCQFCGEVFAKGCALGGHMSKRHADRKMEEQAQPSQNSSTNLPIQTIQFTQANERGNSTVMQFFDSGHVQLADFGSPASNCS
jgi:hypothetical protein